MNMKQNKMLLAVAVLAITMSVFAVLPMDDTDAADPLDIVSVTLEDHPDRGAFLQVTFNQDLAGVIDFKIPEISYITQIDMDKRSNKAVANLFLEDKTVSEGVTYTLDLSGKVTFTDTFTIGAAPVPPTPGEPETYDVVLNYNEGGEASVDVDKAKVGEFVKLTVNPDDGYQTKSVEQNGNSIDLNTDNIYDFEMIEGGLSIVVTFEEVGTPGPTPSEPEEDIVWETVVLTGVLDSPVYGQYNQIIVVSDDLTIKANGSITVLGQFIVEDGATVTFEAGSSISFEAGSIAQIDGDVIIEAADETVAPKAIAPTFEFAGKEMTIGGSMVLEGKNAFAITNPEAKVTISGYFEIAEEASADLANATLAEGGLIIIYGVVTTDGGEILVNGQIDVISEGSEAGAVDMDVQLGLTGVIDITNLYGKMTVNDFALKFDDKTQQGGKKDAAYDNSIVLTNVNGVTISEVMEVQNKTDKLTGDKYKFGNNAMLLAGSISVASDYIASETIKGSVDIDGDNVRIVEDASIGVPVTVDGLLTVEAVVDATAKDVTITNSGVIDVLGEITASAKISGGVVNAAMYETDDKPPYYVYTTIKDALASGATKIAVTGKITISEDLVIPVGTTVDASDAIEVTIKDTATVTVQADAESRKSGRFNTPAGIDSVIVDGTLVVEDAKKSGVKVEAILSDTTKAVEDAVTYTNVYNALKNANEGETVKITRDKALLLEKDLTIPVGVTLEVPAGEDVTVDNDVTVTVNGTLEVIGNYVMEPEIKDKKEAGATVVNGKMIIGNNYDYTSEIVGAYYEIDDDYVVTPLATAAAAVNDIESDGIDLYGEQTVDVSFAGYAPEKATDSMTLRVHDGLSGDIVLGKVILEAEVINAPLNLTVILSKGSVIIDNVIGIIAASDVETLVGEEDVVISVAYIGVIGFDDKETKKVIEAGSVSFTGEITAALATVSETENVNGPNFGEVITTVPADATVTLFYAEVAGPIVADGTVLFSDVAYDVGAYSESAGTLEFVDMTVMGTAASIPVDEDEEPITATVTGMLFVGITAEDLGLTDLAATASAIDVKLGSAAVAYVAPGSTVGDVILDNVKSTEYYDDKDVLYVTAYGVAAIDDIALDPENAIWMYWMYENDKGDLVMVSTGTAVGTYEKVTAKINYEIYQVVVIADNGIGAVAIDGLQLVRDGNKFTNAANNLLKAGTHNLSYKLDAGYDDVNVVIKVDGVAVSGLDFTLQGTPENDANYMTVYINIEGTEKVDLTPAGSGGSAGGEKDGMSLTEILLIVLVVLILIMAIIVALRLMRS